MKKKVKTKEGTNNLYFLGWQQTNAKFSKPSSPYKQHESPPPIHHVRTINYTCLKIRSISQLFSLYNHNFCFLNC